MKFNEKLIDLRKKAGLSQEELGYKLDVTRQTISKWELAQTTPEMEKIIEISKVFNVSVDELINSKEETEKANETEENNIEEVEKIEQNENIKNTSTEKPKRETIIKIGLIILLIFAIIGIFYSIDKKKKEKESEKLVSDVSNTITEGTKNILDSFGNTSEKINAEYEKNKEELYKKFEEERKNKYDELEKITQEQKEQREESNKRYNNSVLEMYSGEKNGSLIKILCEKINTINKKETEKIEIKYEDIVTTDERTIIEMKQKFENHKKYEVILDYSKDGYVNKVEIQNIK